MSAARASFEVQVQKDGRWIADILLDREEDARSAAQRLFSDLKCPGVRIFRNWLKADGTMIETQIHCETRIIKDREKLKIGLTDAPPPPCDHLADYYGIGSRHFMNRIFRAYCDKFFLTPSEILHDSKELKRLQDTENLLSNAVDRVAVLQTQGTEEGDLKDPKIRKEQIFAAISQILARARKVEKLKLPKPAPSLSAVLEKLEAESLGENTEYLALVALSRDLLTYRSWLGKLEHLLDLAMGEEGHHAIEILDNMISDVLMSNVLADLLGSQNNLATAIIAMLDLADGTFPPASSDAPSCVTKLNALIGGGLYPRSKACLVDRAHRLLRSNGHLCSDGTEKEVLAFATIVRRVLTPTGLISGPDTAAALTARYTRLVIQGGVSGRKAAILWSFKAMPDLATGVVYLCDLAASEYAAEHIEDMINKFSEVMRQTSLHGFCEKGLTVRERLSRANLAHHAVSLSPFSDGLKDQVTTHIDSIMDKFLVEEEIIEKLDHASATLHERAQRLVQFCASGVLPPRGKAINRTRNCILNMLRQPNFDQRFVEDIPDPAKGQESLRNFHQLLVKAGFG